MTAFWHIGTNSRLSLLNLGFRMIDSFQAAKEELIKPPLGE
jgi:hypothetical protein